MIVFVTAEPVGFYHFNDSLRKELLKLDVKLFHLVPAGSEFSLLKNYFSVTEDINILAEAEVVIITGGFTSGWTRMIGLEANRLGKKLIFIELAYPGYSFERNTDLEPVLDFAFVSSYETKALVCKYFNLDNQKVKVIGLPMLDDVPIWVPSYERKILVASSVSSELQDGGRILFDWAEELVSSGWNVSIALHPRENKIFWSGFDVLEGKTLDNAANTDLVVTYPGSILVPLGHMGVPTIIPMFEAWLERMTPLNYLKSSYLIHDDIFMSVVNRIYNERKGSLQNFRVSNSVLFVNHLKTFLQ